MKIISSSEMSRIEKIAFSEGASDIDFMETAGKGIAEAFMLHYPDKHEVVLLCGKGNNAGDAYVAGRILLLNNYPVKALQLFPIKSCSPLCQKQAAKFFGEIYEVTTDEIRFPKKGVILDGILGTGFKGKLDEALVKTIVAANNSHLPIVSIDIPSGVNGDTGEVNPIAIKAKHTFFLEFPKAGFFINKGWSYIGSLKRISFGLKAKYQMLAASNFQLLEDEIIRSKLPVIRRTQDKYQVGQVIGLTGSPGMPGAANLSSLAAMRGGAGITKLWLPKEMQGQAHLNSEIISFYYDNNDITSLISSFEQASGIYVGPGIGKSDSVKKVLKEIFSIAKAPLVIDADALNLISEDDSIVIPKHSILTPHLGEMNRLLGLPVKERTVTLDYLALCQHYCNEHDCILVLKGSPTFILYPKGVPYVSTKGDPGMATAGSGDVLTGILAALLARRLKPLDAAVLGVYLHGLAGEFAAKNKTSYSLIASDLIESIPLAYKYLISSFTLL